MPKTTLVCAAVVWLAAIGYHAIKATGHAAKAGDPVKLAIPLDRLPKQLGRWRGKDIQLPDDVVRVAGANTHLRRDYVAGGGKLVSLYIAFYGNVQDSVPHGPTICYPSAGWATRSNEVITLRSRQPGLEELSVQKLLYEKDFSQVAVLYWYAANGEQQAGTQWLRYDAARRKLFGLGGAFVTQVMVSTQVGVSQDEAFALVQRFLQDSFDAIAQHFPQPRPQAN